jgi:hypothetical protein
MLFQILSLMMNGKIRTIKALFTAPCDRIAAFTRKCEHPQIEERPEILCS